MPASEDEIVFVSHSWLDSDLIDPFIQEFFPKKDCLPADSSLIPGFRVVYSSDANDPDKRVRVGAQIWSELENYLLNCSYFLAFVSENYFRSQTCQNELGAIAVLQGILSESKRPAIIPVLLEPLTEHQGFNQIINKGRNYLLYQDAQSVGDILEYLKPIFKPNKYNQLKRGAKKVAKAIKEAYGKPRTAHSVKNLVLAHFGDRTSTDNPVTYFVKRLEYELISVQLSKCGKQRVVWSVYHSPLLVTSAYQTPSLQTHYDEAFQNLAQPTKIRLVIFGDYVEANAYVECELEWHKEKLCSLDMTKRRLRARQRAFEKSCLNSTLLFTTIPALNQFLGIEKENPTGLKEEDFLEFGYFDFDSGHLLFNSGFYSGCETGDSNPQRPEAYYQVGHFMVHKPDLCNEVAELFARQHCHRLFGHLKHLERIAEEVVSPHPNPAFFVTKDKMKELKTL